MSVLTVPYSGLVNWFCWVLERVEATGTGSRMCRYVTAVRMAAVSIKRAMVWLSVNRSKTNVASFHKGTDSTACQCCNKSHMDGATKAAIGAMARCQAKAVVRW